VSCAIFGGGRATALIWIMCGDPRLPDGSRPGLCGVADLISLHFRLVGGGARWVGSGFGRGIFFTTASSDFGFCFIVSSFHAARSR
jgi:hypothetical protein